MRYLKVFAGALLATVSATAFAQDFDPMQMADTDTNGKVSLEEYQAFWETGWGFFSQGADAVKVADLDARVQSVFAGITPDGDGMVTHAVYTASQPARFKAADKDGDGSLSAEELSAVFAPPAQ